MSLLKSAWEIALEKTENIEIDTDKIRRDNLIDEGRRMAGAYLGELDALLSTLESNFEKKSEIEKPLIKKGLALTVLANIALPQGDDYQERVVKMQHIAALIDKEEGESVELLSQIGTFMGKYLDSRDNLLERARAQYKPLFDQKKQQMEAQYGRATYSSMEQDPEFIGFLQKNYNQLSTQFQQTLNNAKEQLKENWNIEK
ncbi:MAG: hypothetical protein EOM67_00070 [Spirochaetia bacterium]|nr:hypothetical protein [Spirochaetia bacterium]